MNLMNLLPALISAAIGLGSFYFAIRAELKKNTDKIMNGKISDEKRHGNHEQRLALIEEKLGFLDNHLKIRLDDIGNRISDLSKLYIEHLKEGHL
jgi:hypothetical protein